VIGIFTGAYEAMKVIWGGLPGAIGDFAYGAANALIGGVEAMLNGVVERINTFINGLNAALALLPEWATGEGGVAIGTLDPVALNRIANPFDGAAAKLGTEAATAFSDAVGATYVDGPDMSGFRQSAQEATDTASAYREASGMLMTSVTNQLGQTETAAEGAAGAVVDLNEVLGTGTAAAANGAGGGAEKASEALKLLQKAAEDQMPRVEKLRQEYDALRAAFEQYKGSLTPEQIDLVTQALERQNAVINGGFGDGVKMGLDQYLDSMKTFSESIAEFTVDTLGGLEDVLVDFFLTGKGGFKEFADEAIKQLMRILVQQWIIKPIAGFLDTILPFHTGGIVGAFGHAKMAGRSVGSLPKYHTGGITSGESMAVVRRGEAIMPTTRLSDGTLGIRAEGGAGASITNVVNVNVDGGAAGQSASAQDELGRRLSKQITAALQVEMGKFTQREMRPGGALYKGR
jgi:hypothetical protein